MSKQTGLTFDSILMERIRILKGRLQSNTPRGTITNTDVMKYLLDLHDKYGETELNPKEMVN